MQTQSYDRFLQLDVPPEKREPTGLEGVLREIFPIESYDKTLSLDYLKYELGKPRYGPDECRQLRLTYGRPFRVWLRLNKEQPVEEEVYLGDMPIMIGGGEFIINGAERVVVSQLHRSPGVDYVVETEAGERKLHSLPHHPRARQLDRDQRHQEGHARRPHRPVGQVLGDDAAARHGPGVLRPTPRSSRRFCESQAIDASPPANREAIEGDIAVGDVIDPETGEVYLDSGEPITKEQLDKIYATQPEVDRRCCSSRTSRARQVDPLILTSLKEDPTNTHEEALLKIYQRLRPGNPPQLEKAKELFKEKFQDPNRYRLGKVGRFRINRKFDQDMPEVGDDPAGRRFPQRRSATS